MCRCRCVCVCVCVCVLMVLLVGWLVCGRRCCVCVCVCVCDGCAHVGLRLPYLHLMALQCHVWLGECATCAIADTSAGTNRAMAIPGRAAMLLMVAVIARSGIHMCGAQRKALNGCARTHHDSATLPNTCCGYNQACACVVWLEPSAGILGGIMGQLLRNDGRAAFANS